MKLNKMLLLAGVTGLIGAATPAQAIWCWFGKCGNTSSGGNNSTGGATQVPEPEQLGLFAMGVAVIGFRMFRARRKK